MLEAGSISLAGNFNHGDYSQVAVSGMMQIYNSSQYASDQLPPAAYYLTNGTLSVAGGEYLGGFGRPGQFIQ